MRVNVQYADRIMLCQKAMNVVKDLERLTKKVAGSILFSPEQQIFEHGGRLARPPSQNVARGGQPNARDCMGQERLHRGLPIPSQVDNCLGYSVFPAPTSVVRRHIALLKGVATSDHGRNKIARKFAYPLRVHIDFPNSSKHSSIIPSPISN